MTSVEQAFAKNQATSDKLKYADFYRRQFAGLRPRLLLEIGVLNGGSLRAWQDIFPSARVVGIDINPEIKASYPDLDIFIGDQKDTAFLDAVVRETGIPDIIIDDGGHRRSQQVESFKHLFPKLNTGGLYVIEDIETSFLEDFNDHDLSAIEYMTSLVTPTNFTSTKSEPPGRVFHYTAAAIVVEPNVCLVRK